MTGLINRRGFGQRLLSGLIFGAPLLGSGCQVIKNHVSEKLTNWRMLEGDALEDPIQAVGGDAIVFGPEDEIKLLTRSELAKAGPEVLVNYFTPVFIQQRINTRVLKYPYPQEYDQIGQAKLRRDQRGKLVSYVEGDPVVYAIFKEVPVNGERVHQLTYTAWYPAHPRMKAIDLEEADIDSCVVRVTLDRENCPLFYETIAACGCFHKIFIEKWVENGAKAAYGPPEGGKNYSIERAVKSSISWDVGGLIDEPRDKPRRPVVFVQAGDHKVIGAGSASRLRIPKGTAVRPYTLASYEALYTIGVDGGGEAPFFDMENGAKVRGAERKKEKFLLGFAGVDSAGQPRADDQIKMHFDESTWGDPTIYTKYLRLPEGVLGGS